jgi:hypothetical protein
MIKENEIQSAFYTALQTKQLDKALELFDDFSPLLTANNPSINYICNVLLAGYCDDVVGDDSFSKLRLLFEKVVAKLLTLPSSQILGDEIYKQKLIEVLLNLIMYFVHFDAIETNDQSRMLLELLLKKIQATPDQKIRDVINHICIGQTPLTAACNKSKKRTAKILIMNGADINLPNHYKQMPFDLLSQEEIKDFLKELNDEGLFANQTSEYLISFLFKHDIVIKHTPSQTSYKIVDKQTLSQSRDTQLRPITGYHGSPTHSKTNSQNESERLLSDGSEKKQCRLM